MRLGKCTPQSSSFRGPHITEEQNVCIRQLPLVDYLLKHVNQVVKLSVDIANDNYWFLDPYDVGLLVYLGQQVILLTHNFLSLIHI